MPYDHHKILVRREIWVLRTNPDEGCSEIVEAEGVRRISNVPPIPAPLEILEAEQMTADGVSCLVELPADAPDAAARTGPEGVHGAQVRRIPNVLPDPVFLEEVNIEVKFSAAYGGLFDAVEELSYVGHDAIETTDEDLVAAVGRPVRAMLDIWKEEEGSADYLPQLIAAARRLVDAVADYRRSAFVLPELAAAVDQLAEELSSVPLRTTL
ncbi:hypothetical protein [Actinocorallia aurantiaca]|uniref:Uncharacterized protein n=1 Tax=Actinocorallia aurantiaca TaxID=46204 RepID=A0ABN3U4H9_9ACTN